MKGVTAKIATMEPEAKAGFFKAVSVWLLVGVSQMTPLQAVQFVAAIGASIWSFILIGDWLWKRWKENSGNQTDS
jgi:hypothetical protein